MDTSSYIAIGLATAGAIGTVAWFWVQRTQTGLDNVEKAVGEKADREEVEALKDELHAVKLDMNNQLKDFQLDCQRNFVSNPALMQVMSGLDRTIQQLTQVIQTNAQESRLGIKAINDRIDNLMQTNRAA
jgi:HAMP domain-containing protein